MNDYPPRTSEGDYHRQIVARYYAKLIKRFGPARVMRGIRLLRRFVWKPGALASLERRVS